MNEGISLESVMSRKMAADSSPSGDLRSNGNEDLNFLEWNEVVEFQKQELIPDDDHYTEAYPLPFWMCTSPATDSECEISHLLSHNYHGTSSCPSSPLISRIQAIEDGKRVLMELIQSMPESSYELSLKDIIDDQQILKEEIQKETIKEENLDTAENQHYLPQTKICNSTRVQSSANRTNSQQSRVLKLKMFIPEVLFLFNKKKPKIGNFSRILLRPFFNGSAKPIPTTKEDCKNRKTCSGKRDKKKSRSTVDEGTVSNPTR